MMIKGVKSDDKGSQVSSVKYRGAAPVRQRCTSTHSLNFTRSGTRSQWRSISSGVTWSYLRASADRRAAALTTDCKAFYAERIQTTSGVSVRPSVRLSVTRCNVIESKLMTVWSCGFYRATRMHSADYAVARCPSVCLSVRPSVTRQYWV